MRVFGVKRKAKRTIAGKTALSFGENAIIRFTTVACHFGFNKTIVVHYASKSGLFNEWENNQTNRPKR
ncbi:hypothetical protein E2986_11016 [Frieseomelitta varia]|uniref:Uncharacterized protein n=1 Tax=Frieseomelitta varia TaxID=561572 RepID=A0A833VTY9_9HYME|nr:hypothetical protein E2986_11016 [Frieseomelitta varia]